MVGILIDIYLDKYVDLGWGIAYSILGNNLTTLTNYFLPALWFYHISILVIVRRFQRKFPDKEINFCNKFDIPKRKF